MGFPSERCVAQAIYTRFALNATSIVVCHVAPLRGHKLKAHCLPQSRSAQFSPH